MTIKELKVIIAPMDDNALVLARDRDCINLDMIDVVGHPNPPQPSKTKKGYNYRIDGICYHENMSSVYGYDNGFYDDIKQAIIFCDNG